MRLPPPPPTGSSPLSQTVDSQLAKQSSLAAVSEILNGCMYVFVILRLDPAGLNTSVQVLCPCGSDEECPLGDQRLGLSIVMGERVKLIRAAS